MPYLFTCPHCQTQTLVEDQYSGQSGQCVVCGRPIQLPTFAGQPARSPLRNSRLIRWAVAATLAVLILVVFAMMLVRYGGQGLQAMHENRSRGHSLRNVEKIARALNAYAQDYGTYPPPTTFAADGTTPMHSWRVLILPYLGYQDRFDQYRMDEPWSSQKNLEMMWPVPAEFVDPAAARGMGTESHYALVTGAGTLFPASGPLGPGQVVDDAAKTVLVVEVLSPRTTTLQWTEPGDVDVANMSPAIGIDIGGNHTGGAVVATVDGRGQFLDDDTPPDVIQALLTPAGGEGIPDDVFD